jgi:ribosomal protein S28E/S33
LEVIGYQKLEGLVKAKVVAVIGSTGMGVEEQMVVVEVLAVY